MSGVDWNGVLARAEEAMQADPQDRAAGRRRAQAVAALGEPARGRALMEEHLARHPGDASGWDLMAAYRLAAGDAEGALAASERALGLARGRDRFLYNRACALARLGRPGPALADLARAVLADRSLGPMAREDPDLEPLRAVEGFRQVTGGSW